MVSKHGVDSVAQRGDLLLRDACDGDVSFALDDGSAITAHRAVLRLQSAYFFTMFSSGMAESSARGLDGGTTVELPGVEKATLQIVLEWIYGCCKLQDITAENCMSVLHL